MGPLWSSVPQGFRRVTNTLLNGEFPVEDFAPLPLGTFLLDPEVPPTADAGGPYEINEGGSVLLDGSGSFDVDIPVQTLTFAWDIGNDGTIDVTGVSANFPRAALFPLGYEGPFSVPVLLRVCDAFNCDEDLTVVNVLNVDPEIQAGVNTVRLEGDLVTLTLAAFSDAGAVDTHTATVDWGDGSAVAPAQVTESLGNATTPSSGQISGTYAYGDNGTYTVTVCVRDDDGGESCDTLIATVGNVGPGLTLDVTGAEPFAAAPAFLGRRGVPQTHGAAADDAGSDDLSFAWEFGPDGPALITNLHFNNGFTPDPPPSGSALGVFPFATTDTVSIQFHLPGVHIVQVTTTDDDGGTATDALAKLITGDTTDARSKGYWDQQTRQRRSAKVDAPTLQPYLDLINFASAVFSENTAATLIPQAEALFAGDLENNNDGPGRGRGRTSLDPQRLQALQQGLAAWLNFASGTVGWMELIPIAVDDFLIELSFKDLITEWEQVILDPDASRADLVRVKDYAVAVNQLAGHGG